MTTTNQITKYGNVDDLLFRGKNKSYGAYELRRDYDERLKRSLLSFMLLLTGATIIAVGYNQLEEKKNVDNTIYCPIDDETILTQYQPIKLDEPKPQLTEIKTNQYTNIKIVDKTSDNDPKITEDIIKDNGQIGTKDQDGIVPETPIAHPTQGNGVGEGLEKPVNNDPIDFPEVYPQFPGGEDALENYLIKNAHFPDYEKSLGITEGKVLVSFVVNEDGSISNIVLDKKDKDGFNRVAYNLIKSMPRWTPGSQGGHKVKVNYSIPLSFITED